MKSLIPVLEICVLLILVIAPNANGIGTGCTDLGYDKYNWSCQNFPGFYYNLDQNICTELLTFRLSNISANKSSAIISDGLNSEGFRGVFYVTQAKEQKFKFAPWGTFEVIGFAGDEYLAAYNGQNLMADEQINEVLLDENNPMTITSNSPLKLEEGYELALKSISGNNIYVELSKDGQVIDSKIVHPSTSGGTIDDSTYSYKMTVGGKSNIPQIAVHFINAFTSSGIYLATIDGRFQLSDRYIGMKVDQQYDKMSIKSVDPITMTIIMDNKDNQITLTKGRDILLMNGIHIRTANQDNISAQNPLRYCLYKQ